MSAKTKIVVLQMKELIYTGIFVGLAVLLVVLFLAMFRGHKKRTDENVPTSATSSAVSYVPGVYTASLPLSSQSLDVEVIVDETQIRSIRLVNLDEAVATMYPLMQPTMESLSAQILEKQSTQDITYEENTKYTAYVLLQTVQRALEKAATDAE